MQIDLNGKIILVTGGTGALGRAIVGKALREKARVYFTYHQNAAAAGRLIAEGAKGFRLDLKKREDFSGLKECLKKEIAKLDGLVLNAAMVRDRTIANLSEEEFDEVVRADLTGPFFLVQKMLPLLYRSERGKVVAIASRVGMQGGFGEANYAAAKGGLVSFVKTLAAETGRKGISANAVAPGFMISGMTRNLPEAVREKIGKKAFWAVFRSRKKSRIL